MIESPRCPVCEAEQWEEIGARTYRRSAIDSSPEKIARRLRVLFEIWQPGRDEVTLRSLLCGECGFVTYAPRPSAAEIDAKYRRLAEQADEDAETGIGALTSGELGRAERIFQKFQQYGHAQARRVLDFGGGDGRLVVPFARQGTKCFAVDYYPAVRPEITRLGATLDDISESERFDTIVCSHVIEHLAEPVEVVRRLAGHLREDGVMYVEVPLEVWRRAPLHTEPVTHVNFFTPRSMERLLSRCGLSDLDVRLEGYAHPLGDRAVVISAFGRRRSGCESMRSDDGAADETRALLNPGVAQRIRHVLLNPRWMPQLFWHKVQRILGL